MDEVEMTEELKRKADLLFNLSQASQDSFNKRRSYEWKLCFAIWTVFAVFISIMLRGEITNEISCNVFGGTIGVGLIITGIHGFWLWSVTKANEIDKKKAYEYEREINELLKFHFSKDTENAKERIKKRKYWSMLTQLGITFVLWIFAIITILCIT